MTRDEPPARRAGGGAGPVLVAALLVLVVAVAVGSERADLGEGRSPIVGQGLAGVMVGGFGALMVTGAWLLLFRRGAVRFGRRPAAPVVPWWLRSMVAIGLLLVVMVVGLLLAGEPPAPEEEGTRSDSAAADAAAARADQRSSRIREGVSAAFFVGIALAVGTVVVVVVRTKGALSVAGEDDDDDDDEGGLARTPLRAAVDASLDVLSSEADPRRAVVAAYVRVQRMLAGEGLPRQASETEPEYLLRVLRHYGAAAEPARRLTELFELARYGVAPVDEAMRAEAIEAAVALRDGAVVRTGGR